MGPALLESIYEEALCCEFRLRGVPYERQKAVSVLYKGNVLMGQRLDLVVFERVVVEIKAQRVQFLDRKGEGASPTPMDGGAPFQGDDTKFADDDIPF